MDPASGATHHVFLTLCVASFALGLSLSSALERPAKLGPTSATPVPAREAPAPDRLPPEATAVARAAVPGEIAASPSDAGNGTTEEAERRASGGVAARMQAATGKAEIEQVIRAAALEFGVDQEALLRVAVCESQLDPLAIGPADELGILQFRPKTFRANARALGYTLTDILEVRAQARVAAEMWSRGQQWQWSCAT